MRMKKRCIIKRPDEKYGHVANIVPSLLNLQRLVEGHIESITIADGIVCLCNEDGKLRGLQPNFLIGTIFKDLICGTAVIIGVDGEDFADLPIDFDTWKKLLKEWGN